MRRGEVCEKLHKQNFKTSVDNIERVCYTIYRKRDKTMKLVETVYVIFDRDDQEVVSSVIADEEKANAYAATLNEESDCDDFIVLELFMASAQMAELTAKFAEGDL